MSVLRIIKQLLSGTLAEWLRSGLQNRVHRFNSGRCLQQLFAIIFLAFMWGTASAETAPLPHVHEPDVAVTNGYVTAAYAIAITANCTNGQALSYKFESVNYPSGLAGIHTLQFLYDNDGSVYIKIDGGAEQVLAGCPGTNVGRTVARSLTVKYDTAPPVITITSPQPNQTFATGTVVRITGTATDDLSGIASVSIEGHIVPVVNGAFSYDLLIPVGQKAPWSFGARGDDGAGRTGYAPSVPTNLIKPTAAPTVAPTTTQSPPAGSSTNIQTPTPTPNALTAKPATKTADQNLFSIIFSPGVLIGVVALLIGAGVVLIKIRAKFQRPY